MRILILCVAVTGLWYPMPASWADDLPRFRRHHLDEAFRSEGVAVADFNGDGRRDVAAGDVYYAAPDWKRHPILRKPREFKVNGYSPAFNCFADDVNRDGWADLIWVDFPARPAVWFRNPGPGAGAWTQHEAVPATGSECPLYADVFGDGRRWLVMGYTRAYSEDRVNSASPGKPSSDQRERTDRTGAVAPNRLAAQPPDGPKSKLRSMAIARPGDDPTRQWSVGRVSVEKVPQRNMFHGLGVGDVNGDGLNDLLATDGWFENPGRANASAWTFHAAPLGDQCAHMVVSDFDGDGDNDVASSSAHRYGVRWCEQTTSGWTTHIIDDTISQTHALVLADINDDGLSDLVTGKRFWGHNGHDPGANEPAVLVWYELKRTSKGPIWTKRIIDDDSGVGCQFEVTDMNDDGRLDIVTSNKKGVFYFEQTRNE